MNHLTKEEFLQKWLGVLSLGPLMDDFIRDIDRVIAHEEREVDLTWFYPEV